MEDNELTPKNTGRVDIIPSDNKVSKLENNILQAIEEYSERGEYDKIEALSMLYLRVQENIQHLDIKESQNQENLLLNKQERKIGYVRQIISIALSISLIPLGVYIFLTSDKNTGIFIMGAGFSSAGLSGFLNSEFVKSIIFKNKDD